MKNIPTRCNRKREADKRLFEDEKDCIDRGDESQLEGFERIFLLNIRARSFGRDAPSRMTRGSEV